MTTSPIRRAARLHAVLAAAGVGVGALAGASWPLPHMFGSGTATWRDGVEWAAAGLVLGIAVAAVCVAVFNRAEELSLLMPVGMLTGLVIGVAYSLWMLRGDSEKNDALIGRGVMGAVLGFIVAAVVCIMLGRSLRHERATNNGSESQAD